MNPRTPLFAVAIALMAVAVPARAGFLEDLVDAFADLGGRPACKAAAHAPLAQHTEQDCDDAFDRAAAAAAAVDQGIEQGVGGAQAAGEQLFQDGAACLADLDGCIAALGEEAVTALVNAGDDAFVTLTGRVTDLQGHPLAGVAITAVPDTTDPVAVAVSTHATVSGPDGRWRIDINRYLAYNGPYRVRAAGLFHDFAPVERTITVGP